MQELLITFLLFGLAVLLASTQFKPGSSPPVARRNGLKHDRSKTASQPPVDQPMAPQSVSENAVHSAGATTTTPAAPTAPAQPVPIVAPLLEREPEVTLPLAASLPLQETIQPDTMRADAMPDLEVSPATIVEATDDSDTQKAKDRNFQNVLDEIVELGEGSHEMAISTLRQHAHHANPMVRATAAMKVGELAAKNQGHPPDEMVALLNELLQDGNSEVQVQAAAALRNMQLPVDLT